MDLDKGKESVLESLLRVNDIESAIKSLNYILENKSPFALYIATLDHSNCAWIFDPKTIENMLKAYNSTIEEINEEILDKAGISLEDQECILFLVFTKIDPIIFAPIPIILIEEILEELYNKT